MLAYGRTVTPSTKDPSENDTAAWLARFDGAKWSVTSGPQARKIDRLLVSPEGALVAIDWPDRYERASDGTSKKLPALDGLERLRDADVWLGASGELWATGSLPDVEGTVVLHEGPSPPTIWEPKE